LGNVLEDGIRGAIKVVAKDAKDEHLAMKDIFASFLKSLLREAIEEEIQEEIEFSDVKIQHDDAHEQVLDSMIKSEISNMLLDSFEDIKIAIEENIRREIITQ
jgi:hypothetical protein